MLRHLKTDMINRLLTKANSSVNILQIAQDNVDNNWDWGCKGPAEDNRDKNYHWVGHAVLTVEAVLKMNLKDVV